MYLDQVPLLHMKVGYGDLGMHGSLGYEGQVQAGESPRPLIADISGAENLELVVRTSRWEFCHAVWLDPQVAESPVTTTRITDALNRAEFVVPPHLPRAQKCVATVASPGREHLLDDMLGSFYANDS